MNRSGDGPEPTSALNNRLGIFKVKLQCHEITLVKTFLDAASTLLSPAEVTGLQISRHARQLYSKTI